MARIKQPTTGMDTVIPTASMSDIAFLLLIFFMVTTVFVEYRPEHPPEIPQAESSELFQNRRNLVNLWISPEGIIQIDADIVNIEGVAPIVHEKMRENPQAIMLIKSDELTRYGRVSDVIEELRRANALRIAFAARSQLPGE